MGSGHTYSPLFGYLYIQDVNKKLGDGGGGLAHLFIPPFLHTKARCLLLMVRIAGELNTAQLYASGGGVEGPHCWASCSDGHKFTPVNTT